MGGEVAMEMRGTVGVWRLGRRSYRQAGVLAKILLFSIASIHGGLNITPSERTSSGSPWTVGTGGWGAVEQRCGPGWDGTMKNERCGRTIETQLFGQSGQDTMQRAAERDGKCRMSGLYSTDALASDVIW